MAALEVLVLGLNVLIWCHFGLVDLKIFSTFCCFIFLSTDVMLDLDWLLNSLESRVAALGPTFSWNPAQLDQTTPDRTPSISLDVKINSWFGLVWFVLGCYTQAHFIFNSALPNCS